MAAIGWVLDLDGVVRLGERRVIGSPEAIAALRAVGHRVVFATNNANDTIGEVQKQLSRMGVPTTGGDVVTSATAAATLIEPDERVLVCGGPGVVEAVDERGAVPLDGAAADGAVDAVIVGFHREFDYRRMTVAAQAVLAGARLIATNDDRTYPTPEGLAPAAGSILASIVTATGADPVVAGKPNPPMVTAIADRFAAGDHAVAAPSIVVGDRADTDGALAAAMGLDFALVLSGVADHADAPTDPAPVAVEADLAAVVDRLVDAPPVGARV